MFVEDELVVFEEFKHGAVWKDGTELEQEADVPDGDSLIDKFGVVEGQQHDFLLHLYLSILLLCIWANLVIVLHLILSSVAKVVD